MRPRSRLLLTAIVVPILVWGCGSGFVAVFSESGNPPPAPDLVGGFDAMPLVPADAVIALEIRNYTLPSDFSDIEIRLVVPELGVEDVQRFPSVSTSNVVRFLQTTINIQIAARAKWGPSALRDRDVNAEFAVMVDGVEVADRMPVLLLRQPRATLDQGGSSVLSPLGEEIVVRLESVVLQASDPIGLNNMRARVAFGPDPLNNQAPIPLTSVSIQPDNAAEIRFDMPPVQRPVQAHFVIDSFPSGTSTLYSFLFYRPEIFGTTPGNGASRGGTDVVLSGQALIPNVVGVDAQGRPLEDLDFDRLTLMVEKGGRGTEIPIDRIRQDLSNSNQLVFSMPPSPDGLPGPADVFLRVMLSPTGIESTDDIAVETRGLAVFSYGDDSLAFGPRGVSLSEQPTSLEFVPFLDPARPFFDALALTNDAQGIPFVSLLAPRGNGMFSRLGPKVRVANTGDPLARNPLDLRVGEYFGGRRGGFVVNRGSDGISATYTVFANGDTVSPPVGFHAAGSLSPADPGLDSASGDFNGDGVVDLVVTPELGVGRIPAVFLSHVASETFAQSQLPHVGEGFTNVETTDLDFDGNLDLVFAVGGLSPRALIAFGDGFGSFPASSVIEAPLDLALVGYTPHDQSTLLGVHATGRVNDVRLALVFTGVSGSATSPPAVVVLEKGPTGRTLNALTTQNVMAFPGGPRTFVASAAGDLSGDGSKDLAVAVDLDTVAPLLLFAVVPGGVLTHFPDVVDVGVEDLRNIRGLGIGPATASAPGQAGPGALFVSHEDAISGGADHRISTYFFDASSGAAKLVPPLPARIVDDGIRGIAAGEFFSDSDRAVVDAWVVVAGGVVGYANDGLGELSLQSQVPISVPEILASTLTAVLPDETSIPGQLAAFLTADSRVGVLPPDRPTTVILESLAPHVPASLAGRIAQENSAIGSGDVDGDGNVDLVLMLALPATPGFGRSEESVIMLMRGQEIPQPGRFPFDAPDSFTFTHGNASSMVLGDFATATPTLEIAVAVPHGGPQSDGNHIRFYHFEAGQLVPSYVDASSHVLLVGDEPTVLSAADLNKDGRTDLAVAPRGGQTLRIAYNTSDSTAVDIDGFVSTATPLPVGTTKQMLSADLNGDAVEDLVVLVEIGSAPRDQSVTYFLSTGSSRTVPPERTGSFVFSAGQWSVRDALARLAVGDLNDDGTPDMLIGWDTTGPGDHNLRVLFGNSF